MPQSLGHSVSLVSALIIGDAAIATGLMSTPVIFVASITAIAVFVTPGLYEPATLLRIGTVLLAGLAGPVGLAAAFFGFLLSLVSTEALGVSVSCAAPLPAAAAFRGRRSAPQLPAAVPAGVQYLAKAGEGKNGGHETAHRTFYPGGADAQRGHSSAGRRHPAERPGASGAVAGCSQHGVPVHPFGAGSGGAAE